MGLALDGVGTGWGCHVMGLARGLAQVMRDVAVDTIRDVPLHESGVRVRLRCHPSEASNRRDVTNLELKPAYIGRRRRYLALRKTASWMDQQVRLT
jgi:hypothetical protein